MKKHYQINNKLLRSLLYDNLITAGLSFIVLFIYFQVKNLSFFEFDSLALKIIGLLILIRSIPAAAIYINYHTENKNTSFTIDSAAKKIVITRNEKTKEYSEAEIEKSIYHLAIFHKNKLDRAGRIPMLISDLAYWEIKFKNGDKYYLTNILFDLLNEEPFYKKTEHRYRIFNYIKKIDRQKILEKKLEINKKNEVDLFLKKFKSKSANDLQKIINDKSSYVPSAVTAAEILLKNRKTLGNNG